MIDLDMGAVLTGSGAAALIYAIAYAYRQWRASRREDRAAPISETSAAVADAATANGLLLSALKEEREAGQAALKEEREVRQRLSEEVADLRAQNADLWRIARGYEREVSDLRTQVGQLRDELADLRRISDDSDGR